MLEGLRFSLAHLLVLLPLLLIPRFRRWTLTPEVALPTVTVIALMSLLPQVISVGYLMLTTPNFTVTESEVAFQAVAALLNQGLPAYPSISSDTIYALLYGPIAYLPFQVILAISDSTITPKVVCTLLTVLFVGLLVLIARNKGNSSQGPLALAGFAVLMGPVLPLLMNPKADVFLALLCTSPWLARASARFIWIVAVCMGLAVGIKFTAVVLFLPHLVYARLYGKATWAALTTSTVIASLIAMAPFIHHAYSLGGYLETLSIAAKHELVPIGIWMTPLLLIPLFGPAARLILSSTKDKKDVLLGCAVVTSFLLSIPAATKLGSGLYHYYPWIASALVWTSLLDRPGVSEVSMKLGKEVSGVMVAAYFIIAATVVTFTLAATPSRLDRARYFADESAAFQKAIALVQPPFGIISGSTPLLGDADFRADTHLLDVIRAGGTLQIGSFAMLDLWGGGVEPSAALLDSFARCTVPRYVGYTDQRPWQTWALYADRLYPGHHLEDPRTNVFGPTLPKVFLEHYSRKPLIPGYDLWTCDSPGRSLPSAAVPELTAR